MLDPETVTQKTGIFSAGPGQARRRHRAPRHRAALPERLLRQPAASRVSASGPRRRRAGPARRRAQAPGAALRRSSRHPRASVRRAMPERSGVMQPRRRGGPAVALPGHQRQRRAVAKHPTVTGARCRIEQLLPPLPSGADITSADHDLAKAGQARSGRLCGWRNAARRLPGGRRRHGPIRRSPGTPGSANKPAVRRPERPAGHDPTHQRRHRPRPSGCRRQVARADDRETIADRSPSTPSTGKTRQLGSSAERRKGS